MIAVDLGCVLQNQVAFPYEGGMHRMTFLHNWINRANTRIKRNSCYDGK